MVKGAENLMGKVVKYADPHFKENLAKHMALVNPKPIGKELESLLTKIHLMIEIIH
jgi:hypothetical protein